MAIALVPGCGVAQAPVASPKSSTGPNPTLPAPAKQGLIPTIKFARTQAWAAGETPKAPKGFAVSVYADKFDHPRWLYVLPNGDVLVAQASTQAKRVTDV